MTRRILAFALALPLVAFDCGGKEDPPVPGTGCTLQIRGAVSEDLWCIVTAYDYSALDPTSTEWVFELVAYRTMTEPGGEIGFFLPARASLGTAYGWSGNVSTVESGSASRTVGDPTVTTVEYTHEALAPLLGTGGTGALSATFTAIPPVGATGEQMIAVHGTATGTLPSLSGGAPVTFSATF